jgi:hypothetical protein
MMLWTRRFFHKGHLSSGNIFQEGEPKDSYTDEREE